MPPIDWYYARGNKQMGPVSSTELKRLATADELSPDDLVWREGLAEWAPARSVRGLFDEEPKPNSPEQSPSKPVVPLEQQDLIPKEPIAPIVAAGDFSNTAWRPDEKSKKHPLDLLLDSLRSDFNARFINATSRLFRTCGLYGLWLGIVTIAAYAAISANNGNALGNLLSGVMVILLLVVLQYIAGKFCDALDRLNRKTGGSLASTALPDGVALLCLVAGLVALFGSVPLAVETSMYPIILLGIAGFIIFGFAAFAALNPSTLGISIAPDETPASHEAINVVLFLWKIKIRCVPVVFGAGVLAGTAMMGDACYEAFFNPDLSMPAQLTANIARTVLIVSAALPLVMYLSFLLYCLLLDLCRAVLARSGRSDATVDQNKDTRTL
jgi:hypothetical protein